MLAQTIARIRIWGSFVKFSHTIFALPFAASMLLVVYWKYPVTEWQIAWILVALVAARTAAMAYNRLSDLDIDSLNPRTLKRELPSGQLSLREARLLFVFCTVIFVCAAWRLGLHCLWLSPLVLVILLFYSWTKRFTSFSHVILGLALALAPGGVWYAITTQFSSVPVWMMLGVLFWVAGFDVLYSCQDIEFDRQHHLFSIPAYLGVERGFLLARIFHFLSVVFLAVFGAVIGAGWCYYTGLFLFSVLLASQHRIISPMDLSRINAAFFERNGLASIVFFLGVLAETVLLHWQ